MPTLNWIGKDKVISHHNDVPFRVLDRKYTYGDTPDSGNMIIHGDNLEALKALLPKYEGQIKCIYIDPPYNTGNENWVYNDNVNDPRIRKWLGQIVGSEVDDLTRHDKWLCMMYPRLALLQRLLSPDGVIFISIDDNELINLRMLCNEIFGANNFVSQIVWHNNKKGRQMDKFVKTTCEYVLMYAKKIDSLVLNEKEIAVDVNGYPFSDEVSAYKKGYPLHNGTAAFHIDNRPNLCYTIYYDPLSNNVVTIDEKVGSIGAWELPVSTEGQLLIEKGYARILPKRNTKYNTQRVWRWGQEKTNRELSELFFVEEEDGWYPYQKERVGEEGIKTVKFTNYFDVDTSRGRNVINSLFDNTTVFDFPKPTELIEYLVSMIPSPKFILDSFAGSGTTAHAVLNSFPESKFILVEMGDYANSVTAERIKRVISNGEKNTSFDFYELGEPVFHEDGNLNESVGLDNLRQYIWYSETNTALCDDKNNGYFLGSHNYTDYYFYYEPEKETVLSRDTLNSFVKKEADAYIIYADICRLDKAFLQKHNITFKKIPRDVKHI